MIPLLVLGSTLVSPLASADVECPDPAFPSRCFAVGVKAGAPAPMAGDLFTVDLAIHLNQQAAHCEDRIDAAVTATVAAKNADAKHVRAVLDADRRVVEVERDAYKREAERPFIEHPAVVATLTALVITVFYVSTGLGDRLREEIR